MGLGAGRRSRGLWSPVQDKPVVSCMVVMLLLPVCGVSSAIWYRMAHMLDGGGQGNMFPWCTN